MTGSRNYYVYILTNYNNTVLYTGVTNYLIKRVREHKEKRNLDSFSSKYNLNELVYYELFSSVHRALSREKQIKAGSRKKKVELIDNINKKWRDLYEDLF